MGEIVMFGGAPRTEGERQSVHVERVADSIPRSVEELLRLGAHEAAGDAIAEAISMLPKSYHARLSVAMWRKDQPNE